MDVTINGQGPFRFVLDTGASHPVVNKPVAEQLGLPTIRPSSRAPGILTVGESVPVRVKGWKAGDVDMPTTELVRGATPNPPGRRFRLDGLPGADALSRSGVIHVDFTGQVLVLNPRADRGRPTAE